MKNIFVFSYEYCKDFHKLLPSTNEYLGLDENLDTKPEPNKLLFNYILHRYITIKVDY